MLTNNNEETICGCKYIAESIKNSELFGKFYVDLLTNDTNSYSVELGEKPSKMPIPSVSPISIYHNDVRNYIDGLPLTYMELTKLSRYGVYHSMIALFGDRHWLVKDRAGSITLRVFENAF